MLNLLYKLSFLLLLIIIFIKNFSYLKINIIKLYLNYYYINKKYYIKIYIEIVLFIKIFFNY